jgi:hypothetical protein
MRILTQALPHKLHQECPYLPGLDILPSRRDASGAREQQIIADVDLDAVAHTLLGGLLTLVVMNLVLGEAARPPVLERADAVVQVIMHALTP